MHADIDGDTLLKFNARAHAKKLETDGDGKIPVELQLADEQNFPHQGHIVTFDNRLDTNTGSISCVPYSPTTAGALCGDYLRSFDCG